MPKTSRQMSMWLQEEQKAAPPASYGGTYGGGPWFTDQFRTRRAPSPTELVEAYRAIEYCCANLNARAVAKTPLRLYVTTKKRHSRPKCGTKSIIPPTRERILRTAHLAKALAGTEDLDEVTDHPLLDALDRVNSEMDRVQLIMSTALYMDIVGHAFWWPYFGNLGIPKELWVLPSQAVFPVFDGMTMVPSRWQFGSQFYYPDEIVKFKHISPKNPYGAGYGPNQASFEYSRLEGSFLSIQDDMLSNGPRPNLVVSHRDPKGAFGDAERKRLELAMNQKARGGNAGSVFVVDGAATVQPVSWQPADIGSLGISTYDLKRIANAHDVPVSMLDTEDVNRANAEAGQEQHARNAVQPRCETIESAMTRWIHSLDKTGKRGWDRLFFKFDSVVREDKQAEADWNEKNCPVKVITVNEVRLNMGYKPDPDGDVILVPNNLIPLSAAVKPPEPPPQLGDPEAADQPGTEGGPERQDEGEGEDAETDAFDESQDDPEDEAEKAIEDRLTKVLEKLTARVANLP